MKVYTKDGVKMEDNDVYFLREGDIVYLDLLGQPFNSAQLLDQYTQISCLSMTPSTEVHKLQDKDTKKFFVQKIVKFDNSANIDADIEDFIRHVNKLRDIQHGNVVR